MAGGKLSPRQKMINMMYLVLLALLAMNVSKEILDAFEVLKDKLAISAMETNSTQDALVQSMLAEVKDEMENEGKDVNKGLLDTLPSIRAKTNQAINMLEKHYAVIERLAGKDSITGEYMQKDELEANLQYWMGVGGPAQEKNPSKTAKKPRGDGQAKALKDSLLNYFDWIVNMHNSQLRTDSAQSQRMSVEEIENAVLADQLASGPDNDDAKSWETKTFDGPAIANLAMLQALKTDVYNAEKQLLERLNERLGVAKFKIDKMIGVTAPTATIVPAGLQFEAQLYVTMSSNQIQPTFSGSGVTKNADGNSATLKLPANGSIIPKGKKEGIQKYSATISVPKATGGFEVLPVSGEFIVRKPEVVVTSATVQNLYRSCGNAINIDVPALGDQYNPKVTVSSGTITQSKESRQKFLIVPTGRKCIVGVSTLTNGQTIKIGDVNYTVIEPPKPTVQMKVNGKNYNGASPVPATSRIVVQILADKEFKAALPNDARYGISTIDVLAQLSLGPPKKVNTVRGNSNAEAGVKVSMGTAVRQAPRGTKVYVRINEIFRKNFQGKSIPDQRFSEVERTLSLVTR